MMILNLTPLQYTLLTTAVCIAKAQDAEKFGELLEEIYKQGGLKDGSSESK